MLIEAFIRDGNIPGASVAYWIDNPSKATEVITKAILILNVSVTIPSDCIELTPGDSGLKSILADVILIWRLYVIWGRNGYICIVPVRCLKH
jgi:hypothetical protein